MWMVLHTSSRMAEHSTRACLTTRYVRWRPLCHATQRLNLDTSDHVTRNGPGNGFS